MRDKEERKINQEMIQFNQTVGENSDKFVETTLVRKNIFDL